MEKNRYTPEGLPKVTKEVAYSTESKWAIIEKEKELAESNPYLFQLGNDLSEEIKRGIPFQNSPLPLSREGLLRTIALFYGMGFQQCYRTLALQETINRGEKWHDITDR